MGTETDIISANIELHTALAGVYRATEPHYRHENIDRIRARLLELAAISGRGSLLDIGCGQGFIIDIAKEIFSRIRGIDITPAMLEKVDLSSKSGCDIAVSIGTAEALPFDDETFDMCTAYAVLHHLEDIPKAAKEAYRALRPGGIFFSALDPNHYYWQALKDAQSHGGCKGQLLEAELRRTLGKDVELSHAHSIPLSVIDAAESYKHIKGGFTEESMAAWFHDAGFSRVEVKYDWFFAQGAFIHDPSLMGHVGAIDSFLQNAMPISRSLYKYISVTAMKQG